MNLFRLYSFDSYLDGQFCNDDGSEVETFSSSESSPTSISRTTSIPVNFESSVDTMRLAEAFVAAEHALRKTISDPGLWKSLSSLEEFEKKYLELSKGAADNYHLSWWNRHGVVLDGEIAATLLKHVNYDQSLFLTNERQAFQSELVRLAHSEMEDPVPFDVSSLITFAGNYRPPMELCDGDPGTLPVTLWSEFPDDITLESVSLTLTATNNADARVKAIKSSDATILNTGRNTITLSLPPQKPGAYVLGVLTGQIGHLRFRSHGYSRGGPADSDDLLSFDKPTRPILKVLNPRPVVDLTTAVLSALLMNEPQWVGVVLKPINYALKDAVLHIETGPELKIEESCSIEMEKYSDGVNENSSAVSKEFAQLTLKNGSIDLPDWASSIFSVLWIPVRAIKDGLSRGTSAGFPCINFSPSLKGSNMGGPDGLDNI